MKGMQRIGVALAAGLVLCAGGAIAVGTEPAPTKEELPQGSFDLRPKFRIGQDRRVRLKLESHETSPDLLAETDEDLPPTTPKKSPKTSKPAAESEVNTWQEFVLIFRPTKVGEEASEVEVVFESIKSKVDGPGVDDTFDSSKPAPKPAKTAPKSNDPLQQLEALAKPPSLEELMRPLVGEALTLTLDRDGNITDVRGGQKLVRALNPMASAAMAQMGGDAPIRDLFKSIVGMPGKPHAKPGESWSSATNLDVFPIGNASLRTDYKLTSVQGNLGKIVFSGGLKPREDPSPGGGGLTISKAEYGGTTNWDQADGFAASMNAKQELNAELAIGQSNVKIRQHQTVTMERLGDAAGAPKAPKPRE